MTDRIERCLITNDCDTYKKGECHCCNNTLSCPVGKQAGYVVSKNIKFSKLPSDASKKINIRFIKSDTADYNAYDKIVRYCIDMENTWVKEGKNIVLWSENCGNGKTFWASKLGYYVLGNQPKSGLRDNDPNRAVPMGMNNEYEVFCPVKFVSVVDLLQRIKDSWTTKDIWLPFEIEALSTVDLVIWDDFVLGQYDKTALTTMYDIINKRISDKKSSIFTTNINPNEWEKFIGAQLTSRIRNNSDVIQFRNSDLRGSGI